MAASGRLVSWQPWQMTGTNAGNRTAATYWFDHLDRSSTDQLRVTAEILMGLLMQASPYLLIRSTAIHLSGASGDGPSLLQIISLDSAVELFGRFCASTNPRYYVNSWLIQPDYRLQSMCIVHLLLHGCSSEWWGRMFTTILTRHFCAPEKPDDQRFIFYYAVFK
jgi:hypothetical protein